MTWIYEQHRCITDDLAVNLSAWTKAYGDLDILFIGPAHEHQPVVWVCFRYKGQADA